MPALPDTDLAAALAALDAAPSISYAQMAKQLKQRLFEANRSGVAKISYAIGNTSFSFGLSTVITLLDFCEQRAALESNGGVIIQGCER